MPTRSVLGALVAVGIIVVGVSDENEIIEGVFEESARRSIAEGLADVSGTMNDGSDVRTRSAVG